MTKNARLLVALVEESFDHPTAEQLYLRAKEIAPTIAMATVYSNLKRLCEEGKLRRIVGDGADRYDNVRPHDHFVCARCGQLRDAQLEGLLQRLQAETGEKILAYDLTLHYLCKDCRGEKEIKSQD